MTTKSLQRFSLRSTLWLFTATASVLGTGCAGGGLFDRPVDVDGVKYDAQTCVEHALRNNPDPEAVQQATVAFADACRGGEAAACSAEGVMYELGRGFIADEQKARDLYRTACEAHNLRGCANLNALMAKDETAPRTKVASR